MKHRIFIAAVVLTLATAIRISQHTANRTMFSTPPEIKTTEEMVATAVNKFLMWNSEFDNLRAIKWIKDRNENSDRLNSQYGRSKGDDGFHEPEPLELSTEQLADLMVDHLDFLAINYKAGYFGKPSDLGFVRDKFVDDVGAPLIEQKIDSEVITGEQWQSFLDNHLGTVYGAMIEGADLAVKELMPAGRAKAASKATREEDRRRERCEWCRKSKPNYLPCDGTRDSEEGKPLQCIDPDGVCTTCGHFNCCHECRPKVGNCPNEGPQP